MTDADMSVLAPEPLIRLLRASSIPPALLLRTLKAEIAIRGRLATAGRTDLIELLSGLGPVNLILRNRVVEGSVRLGPPYLLEFGATDALVHAGTLPTTLALGIVGRPIGNIADVPGLRDAAYPIVAVREYTSPPMTAMLFHAPRLPLLTTARSSKGR